MTEPGTLDIRLTEGEGADISLNAEIAVAFGDVVMREHNSGYAFFHAPIQKGDWAFLSGCTSGREEAMRSLGCCLSVKHYTSSIDACIALAERLLPKSYTLIQGSEGDHWVVTIRRSTETHKSLTRAFLLALIRAQEPAHD